MSSVYIRPIALCDSPQSEEGAAIRLGGGLVYASRFALIVRDGVTVSTRQRLGTEDLPTAIAALPDHLAAEATAQWENLRRTHAPLVCGQRMLRLDQPQIMGILNVTPDSFSDGGQFLDNPETALDHAHAML
ncbi:MAG: dihydropteroate synthase, partial [Novosphingobium sp. 35-62-5]